MSPPPGPGTDVATLLYEAMDRAALAFLSILEDEEADINQKMRVFTQAQDWLGKREKFRPTGPDAGSEGIEMLRSMLDDPVKTIDRILSDKKCYEELEIRGWLPPPPKPAHRPTDAQAKARRRYEARGGGKEPEHPADDSTILLHKLGKV